MQIRVVCWQISFMNNLVMLSLMLQLPRSSCRMGITCSVLKIAAAPSLCMGFSLNTSFSKGTPVKVRLSIYAPSSAEKKWSTLKEPYTSTISITYLFYCWLNQVLLTWRRILCHRSPESFVFPRRPQRNASGITRVDGDNPYPGCEPEILADMPPASCCAGYDEKGR